jgi:hypothetical protein
MLNIRELKMSLYFGLAGGVFVGNFIFHALQGNYTKGAAIGAIAAVLVLIVGFCRQKLS